MTLDHLVQLASAYRSLDAKTAADIDLVLGNKAANATTAGLTAISDWLQEVERFSGNDEELADDIGGALLYVRTALSQKAARDERES